MCQIIQLTPDISYLPPSNNPLSANVGIVRCQSQTFFYDAGSSAQAAQLIDETEGKKSMVLSHFHPDHTANVVRIHPDCIYGGKQSIKICQLGFSKSELITVQNHIFMEDNVKIHILPFPNSHEKGSLALEVNEEYVFLGDATYCKALHGGRVYNPQLLQEEIKTLENLKARFALVSHEKDFLQDKEKVLAKLKKIYSYWDKRSKWIEL